MISDDADVTFASGSLTIHGSVRLPISPKSKVSAALLIAGSGPTDRNGNSAVPGVAGIAFDELRWLADVVSEHGWASLRYDKFGSGATGLGPYQPSDLGSLTFEETALAPAREALAFLSQQPGIDPTNLMVVGHSEGGMVSLALMNNLGDAPAPAALALIEPQYGRILAILRRQLVEQFAAAASAGLISAEESVGLTTWLDTGIAALHDGDTPTADAPPLPNASGVAAQFQAVIAGTVRNPLNAAALRSEDLMDPIELARLVHATTRVLVTCGDKDVNTPCADVEQLANAFPAGVAKLVHLPNTVHELRDIGNADLSAIPPTDYPSYPFSTALHHAFGQFLD